MEQNTSQIPISNKQTDSEKKLEANIKSLEEERWNLQNQIGTLKRQLENKSKSSNESDLNLLSQKLEISQNEVQAIQCKYEELRNIVSGLESYIILITSDKIKLVAALGKFEAFLPEINAKVESITKERDNCILLYQQVNLQLIQERNKVAANLIPEKNLPILSAAIQTEDVKSNEINSKYEKLIADYRDLEAVNKNMAKDIQRLMSNLDSAVNRGHETGTSAVEALRQLEAERDMYFNL